jgi:hypothetical protein
MELQMYIARRYLLFYCLLRVKHYDRGLCWGFARACSGLSGRGSGRASRSLICFLSALLATLFFAFCESTSIEGSFRQLHLQFPFRGLLLVVASQ